MNQRQLFPITNRLSYLRSHGQEDIKTLNRHNSTPTANKCRAVTPQLPNVSALPWPRERAAIGRMLGIVAGQINLYSFYEGIEGNWQTLQWVSFFWCLIHTLITTTTTTTIISQLWILLSITLKLGSSRTPGVRRRKVFWTETEDFWTAEITSFHILVFATVNYAPEYYNYACLGLCLNHSSHHCSCRGINKTKQKLLFDPPHLGTQG